MGGHITTRGYTHTITRGHNSTHMHVSMCVMIPIGTCQQQAHMCMHICQHTWVYVCQATCGHSARVYTCVHTFANTGPLGSMPTHVDTHQHMYAYACKHTVTDVHVHMSTHAHMSLVTCAYLAHIRKYQHLCVCTDTHTHEAERSKSTKTKEGNKNKPGSGKLKIAVLLCCHHGLRCDSPLPHQDGKEVPRRKGKKNKTEWSTTAIPTPLLEESRVPTTQGHTSVQHCPNMAKCEACRKHPAVQGTGVSVHDTETPSET